MTRSMLPHSAVSDVETCLPTPYFLLPTSFVYHTLRAHDCPRRPPPARPLPSCPRPDRPQGAGAVRHEKTLPPRRHHLPERGPCPIAITHRERLRTQLLPGCAG